MPEDVIFALLSKRLEEGYYRGESGFILDGIPRTRIQAVSLEFRYTMAAFLFLFLYGCCVIIGSVILNKPVDGSLCLMCPCNTGWLCRKFLIKLWMLI